MNPGRIAPSDGRYVNETTIFAIVETFFDGLEDVDLLHEVVPAGVFGEVVYESAGSFLDRFGEWFLFHRRSSRVKGASGQASVRVGTSQGSGKSHSIGQRSWALPEGRGRRGIQRDQTA